MLCPLPKSALLLLPLQMEDRAVCMQLPGLRQGSSFSFYGVYDGHHGSSAAQFVSERLHHAIASAVPALPRHAPGGPCISALADGHAWGCRTCVIYRWRRISGQAVEAAVRSAFLATDAAFLEQADAAGDSAGSTAVVALCFGQHFLIAHVGDSRALLCRRNDPAGQPSNPSLSCVVRDPLFFMAPAGLWCRTKTGLPWCLRQRGGGFADTGPHPRQAG